MKRAPAVALLFLPQLLFAQQLLEINLDRERAKVNEPIIVTLEFQAAERVWCGLRVNFGDGDERELGVSRNPLVLKKEYTSAGRYRVRAEGMLLLRGLKTAIPCFGSEQSAQIVVSDPVLEQNAQKEADSRARQLEEKERDLRIREMALEERFRRGRQAGAEAQDPSTSRPSVAAPVRAPKPPAPPPRPKDETMKIFGPSN